MSIDSVDVLHEREDELATARAVLARLVVWSDGLRATSPIDHWGLLADIVSDARLAAIKTCRLDCPGYLNDDYPDADPEGCDEFCGCCDHDKAPA
jgi:hypothetical protein